MPELKPDEDEAIVKKAVEARDPFEPMLKPLSLDQGRKMSI